MKALVLAVILLAAPSQAWSRDDQAAYIEIAATRFGLPIDLIEAVIAIESNGQARAVSSAGAMGLMQLMPGTWAQLRARLGLGDDPFDPADNILAGVAYLRQLHDRYGEPGFLAAYNAGPGRYEASLAGRALPLETRLYVERITQRLGLVGRIETDWRTTGLFPPAWSQGLGQQVAEPSRPTRRDAGAAVFVVRPVQAR